MCPRTTACQQRCKKAEASRSRYGVCHTKWVPARIFRFGVTFVCSSLSKKDKSKLVKLLAKMNLNVNQKQKSSSEILKHIYGNRAGGFYNFGLVEATHKYDFKVKLFSFSKK